MKFDCGCIKVRKKISENSVNVLCVKAKTLESKVTLYTAQVKKYKPKCNIWHNSGTSATCVKIKINVLEWMKVSAFIPPG